MLKIINKLFPFLSKSNDKIDEKQNIQHWKDIPLLTVNQISYLYNNIYLPIDTHAQDLKNLSQSDYSTVSAFRKQLLSAIKNNTLIPTDDVDSSTPTAQLFTKNPYISKEELFKYFIKIGKEGSIPECLMPVSPIESISEQKIKNLESRIKELESKLEGWEPAINHPSEGLKAIADFVNQIYFKDGKPITKISDIPGYRGKEQFAKSLLENKELKLVQIDSSPTTINSLLTIMSTSSKKKKRGPSSKKQINR